MKTTNRASKFLAVLFFLSSPVAVYAACCAGHGGVASCNSTTGYKMCKDGTASPSCTCKKITKSTTTKKTTPATKNTNKTKSTWWGGSSSTGTSTTTKSTTTKGTSAKGCCSRHGGVAQCDTATGHYKCKDGSQSPSCACH